MAARYQSSRLKSPTVSLGLWPARIIPAEISFLVGSPLRKTSAHSFAKSPRSSSTRNLSCLKSNGRCSLKYIAPLWSKSIPQTTFLTFPRIHAPKHIGHGSYVVYNVASLGRSFRMSLASRRASISACPKRSLAEYTRLCPRAMIFPSSSITQPIGQLPSLNAMDASLIASFIRISLIMLLILAACRQVGLEPGRGNALRMKNIFSNNILAGGEGFEPPNAGTKTRCLTTWPTPNRLV
jgi:hypothetical protein